jgi:SagB-type dehydrogenase family enzyme
MERTPAFASVVDVFGVEQDPLDPMELFHEASKLRRHREELLRRATVDRRLGRLINRNIRALRGGDSRGQSGFRSMRNAERRALPLCLPTTEAAGLAKLLRRRTSERFFAEESLGVVELAGLLQLTYGFSGGCVGEDPALLRRPVPSPGGLYSLELYVAALQVASLPRGLYHYEVATHELSRLQGTESGDRFRDVLTSIGGVTGCAAYVIVASVIERLRWKYGARAYRMALLEAGHAGQQLCLAVAALGLAGCPIQAFLDDELADLLGVDGVSELPLHVVGVGRPESRATAPRPEERAAEGSTRAAEGPLHVRAPFLHSVPAELQEWPAVDAEMTQAFHEIARGRIGTARGRLLVLEARLGEPDATIRDYLRLSEQSPPPRLATGAGLLVRFTDDLGPADDESLGQILLTLEQARSEVMHELGLERAPAVFVELPARTMRPLTLVGDRRVQRKVCLPAGIDAEAIRHEMVHAICAPPNVVIAEGLACLAASGGSAIREAEAHLEEDAAERLMSLFRRRAPGATGGEALRDEDAWLVYPLAGSFLLFLQDRQGRDTVLRYASDLVLAGSDATSAEQEARFKARFGVDLEACVTEWSQSRVGGGGFA